MNNQEVFDKVWDWFVVKKHSASVRKVENLDITNCQYRGENNAKCALGIFIPDEMYDPSMEGMGYRLLFDNYPDIEHLLSGVADKLISTLQIAHDDAAMETTRKPENFTYEMEKQLRGIASAWELKIPGE